MREDLDLLQRWRLGDRAAGNELMSRHYDAIHRFFELKVPGVAEDLSQRCFLAAIEGLGRLREGGSIRAYLFGIARHMLLHHLRDQRRHGRVVRIGEADKIDSALTPSRVISREAEQRLVLRALEKLGADHQMALQMFYWEELSNKEIGEVLEIPVSTVTSRIARARDRLRGIIAQLPAVSPRARATVEADLDKWTRSLVSKERGSSSRPEPRPPRVHT